MIDVSLVQFVPSRISTLSLYAKLQQNLFLFLSGNVVWKYDSDILQIRLTKTMEDDLRL
jgi:hypothetical protein